MSHATFGPLVAYLIPGAVVLAGLSPHSSLLRSWFLAAPADAPALAGFLFLTVAALGTGMTVSALRWAVIDPLHARTGIPPPALDFSRLGQCVAAYALLIEIHYRHYLFYANMFTATLLGYLGYRLATGGVLPLRWLDLGVAVLEAIFFATSRDTLRKYYRRSEQLLAPAGQPPRRPSAAPRITPGRGPLRNAGRTRQG